MLIGLLPVERLILESLAKKAKGFLQITLDTGLDEIVAKKVIKTLKAMGHISEFSGVFTVNQRIKKEYLNRFVKDEVCEITNSVISNYFERDRNKTLGFSLKKVFMSEYDKEIYHQKIDELKTFLRNLDLKYNEKRTFGQTIVFFGDADYRDVL